MAVEIGKGQANEVTNLFSEAGLTNIEVKQDIAGIGRLVTAQNQLQYETNSVNKW